MHDHLKILGVSFQLEWDALVFMYRYGITLTSAAQIARFLGCDRSPTGIALERLESLGLIERSPGSPSRRVHLYRFSMPEDRARRSSLVELMSLTEKRTGRLMILSHLERGRRETRTYASGLRFA